MSRRHAGQGATWFKKRAVSRRLNAESRHSAECDLGTRIDICALLGEPIEDFPDYDLDAAVEARAFRSAAARWFTKVA